MNPLSGSGGQDSCTLPHSDSPCLAATDENHEKPGHIPGAEPVPDPIRLDSRSVSSAPASLPEQHPASLIFNALKAFLMAKRQQAQMTEESFTALLAELERATHDELKHNVKECTPDHNEWLYLYIGKLNQGSAKSAFLYLSAFLAGFGNELDLIIPCIKLATYCLNSRSNEPDVPVSRLKADIKLLNTESGPSGLSGLNDAELARWLDTYSFPDNLFHNAENKIHNQYAQSLRNYLFHTIKLPYIRGKISQAEALARWTCERELKAWLDNTIDTVFFETKRSAPSASEQVTLIDDQVPDIDPTQLRFGEEMEFWPDQQCRKIELSVLEDKKAQFIERIETILKSHAIDYETTTYPQSSENSTVIKVGNWRCKIFLDEDVIEVNTTPYLQDQTFQIMEGQSLHDLTSYECFDRFIHAAARELNMPGRSGHKHVDVYQAFHGNAELVFRVMIDMENATWMARAFDREARANNFAYSAKNEEQKQHLKYVTERINQLREDPQQHLLSGSFQHLQNLRSLMSFLGIIRQKAPCNLVHIATSAFKHTQSVTVRPGTTLEFRPFHCPRTGEESRLINKLLAGRFNYLLECQRQRKPIEYPGLLLEDFNAQSAAEAAVRFCAEAGLTLEETRSIIRIPLGEVPEELPPPQKNPAGRGGENQVRTSEPEK